MSSRQDTLSALFVAGARNLHAVEKQALAIMTPQVKRIEHYPDVAEQLQRHIGETEHQIDRLDQILAAQQSDASALKDLGLGLSGGIAAIVHTVAGDEILKNSFANYAFEHFEIAGYQSLIVLADEAGLSEAAALLKQSLGEEQRMAQWIGEAQKHPCEVSTYSKRMDLSLPTPDSLLSRTGRRRGSHLDRFGRREPNAMTSVSASALSGSLYQTVWKLAGWPPSDGFASVWVRDRPNPDLGGAGAVMA